MDGRDLELLRRCVDLAEEAVEAGDEPFGSVLVDADRQVLAEDRNRVAAGDATQHPELALARAAVGLVPPSARWASTVYTSGEHCPMCAAAHAWVGLGRIVYATSSAQLTGWLEEMAAMPSPVRALPVTDVAPHVRVEGPVPELADRVRDLHRRRHAER